VDLDRQTIEKKDFPIGRRGYEPEAVDAHLAALAQEIEALHSSQRSRPGESVASAAAVQVQAIVEAAETTAADIQRQAELDGRRVHQEAEREAERTRDDAVQRAEAHVESVSKATALMLQRVDAMESEISALLENLRAGATRLTADLSLLEGTMGELYDAAGRKAAARGTAGTAARRGAGAPATDTIPEAPGPAPAPDAGDAPVSPAAAIEEVPGDTPEPLEARSAEGESVADATAGAGASADLDGARLIALNMALNGQTREEADRYLSENFDIPDRDALLDEVYAAVEG
jgi:DivIVA domain-containing protein